MRIYILILIILFISCEKNDEKQVNHEDNYGEGIYILTTNGVSYYNYLDTLGVQQNIFSAVNGGNIDNPKRMKIDDDKAYIIGNRLYVVDIKSFYLEGEVLGFNNLVDCDIVSFNRVFALDKGESKLKVVDLDKYEITTHIETGDSTKPSFITSRWYRSFILNGGGIPAVKKDSTMIMIDHKDQRVPLVDFAEQVLLGDNPNSAVFSNESGTGMLTVLCRGIYNTAFPNNDTESSLYQIHPWSGSIIDYTTLSGIYNGQSLIQSTDNELLYLSGVDGVYEVSVPTMTYSLLSNRNTTVLQIQSETYNTTDTTSILIDMIYMNDLQEPGFIFKYNTNLNSFVDSFSVTGDVIDIQIK